MIFELKPLALILSQTKMKFRQLCLLLSILRLSALFFFCSESLHVSCSEKKNNCGRSCLELFVYRVVNQRSVCNDMIDFLVSKSDLSSGRQNFVGIGIGEWPAFSAKQSLNAVLVVYK